MDRLYDTHDKDAVRSGQFDRLLKIQRLWIVLIKDIVRSGQFDRLLENTELVRS